MVNTYGLWPKVAGIAADADILCCDCSMKKYGSRTIWAVIDGDPGWQEPTDHEGNQFTPILVDSEDAYYQTCPHCHGSLSEEDDEEEEEPNV